MWALILALQSTTAGAALLEPTADIHSEPNPGHGSIMTLAVRHSSDATEAVLLANGLLDGEVSITPRESAIAAVEPADNVAVPIPPAAWLFGAAILAFAGLSTRHSR
jgi:hypothetical protein